MKNNKKVSIVCFLADLGLSLWSYFLASNFEAYKKIAASMIDSPDFQVQIYQVLLQSLTFSLILFLSFHLVIYILYWRENNFAAKYVRVYTLLASLSALIMCISSMWWAIFALMAYGWSFNESRKFLKEKKALSSPKSQNAL